MRPEFCPDVWRHLEEVAKYTTEYCDALLIPSPHSANDAELPSTDDLRASQLVFV